MKPQKLEFGSVLLIVAAGLLALLGATALGIDIGYFFLVKNQLQNAADAAAIAGAQGLATAPGNYEADGPARRLAVEYANKNKADGEYVVLNPEEITFCSDERLDDCAANPLGVRNVIRVEMTRNVSTLFGSIFGVSEVSVGVSAAAAVVCTTGGTGAPGGGWRPFAIPDQFANRDSGTRVQTRFYGQPFDDKKLSECGPRCADDPSCTRNPAQDWYMSPFDEGLLGLNMMREGDFGQVTGYIAMRDVIDLYYTPVSLKVGSPSGSLAPGQFFPVTFPPNVQSGGGAAEYRDNIVDGWVGHVQIGDQLWVEPGNMIGPTRQGVRDLIAQDPNARLALRDGAVVVEGSIYPAGKSPRLIPIPMFDPSQPPGSGREFVTITNIGGFFIRRQCGDDVVGTFVPIQIIGGSGGEISACAGGTGYLAVTVQLIQ